ncbi:hypothetical protein [Corynebacterium glutamicum]|uniref:hypothetical protein n=1 Tax=Corynebacterium glutamicum TaxID=1718 RepID=UPI00058A625F|nr:hypothetical protein [Corynebacterium glutamicum]AJE66635.1 hypothetical protein SB89_03200 [Corynebacterium glutamicum]OKX91165.1 hypothetical protein AUP72_08375 [Corynebacterium glutamicum]TWS34043.1 hypothetical protein AKJ21_10995 [Corynebacterium glutamicum]
MTYGFLVNTDLTHRAIDFDLENAAKFLGGADDGRVAVAFQEDGTLYAALYSASAKDEGAAANPVASLGRNAAATGDGSFFSDPTAAICGPVIFVGAEGEDITLDEIERIKDGIRAARNYRDDYPEEFHLWRNAVYNLRTP